MQQKEWKKKIRRWWHFDKFDMVVPIQELESSSADFSEKKCD